MAQPELWRRLLDAGSDLTEMTQKRAEQLVQSLVDAGEVQVDQAQKAAQELVERSRENRSRFLKAVDRERGLYRSPSPEFGKLSGRFMRRRMLRVFSPFYDPAPLGTPPAIEAALLAYDSTEA